MKAGLRLLVIALTLPVLVVISSVGADAGVEVNGSRVKDYTTVNGTAVVSLWVQSEGAVSSVVLSYVDQEGEPACAAMTLTEGDDHDGW